MRVLRQQFQHAGRYSSGRSVLGVGQKRLESQLYIREGEQGISLGRQKLGRGFVRGQSRCNNELARCRDRSSTDQQKALS